MSVHPFYVEYDRPTRRRLPDQHFGLGLTPQDYLTILAVPQANHDYCRPWRNLVRASEFTRSNIEEDKNKFQVNVDVQHFTPDKISVKTSDGFLIVEAKHKDRQDEHGFISRSFTRRYQLPDGVEEETVTSTLSSDGVLSISAPLRAPSKSLNERTVPIFQTGPVKKQGDIVNQ